MYVYIWAYTKYIIKIRRSLFIAHGDVVSCSLVHFCWFLYYVINWQNDHTSPISLTIQQETRASSDTLAIPAKMLAVCESLGLQHFKKNGLFLTPPNIYKWCEVHLVPITHAKPQVAKCSEISLRAMPSLSKWCSSLKLSRETALPPNFLSSRLRMVNLKCYFVITTMMVSQDTDECLGKWTEIMQFTSPWVRAVMGWW